MTEEEFIETAAAEARTAIYKVSIEVIRIISKDGSFLIISLANSLSSPFNDLQIIK
jgi:hypothetical protein